MKRVESICYEILERPDKDPRPEVVYYNIYEVDGGGFFISEFWVSAYCGEQPPIGYEVLSRQDADALVARRRAAFVQMTRRAR